MNNCIVFLDFDGVTHPEPCLREVELCNLPLIETVLLEFPMVAVVISSSWRAHYTLAQMREFFQVPLRSRVIGVTASIKQPSSDWLPGSTPQFEREWECDGWMKKNCEWNTPWLAIDDRARWFRPECPDLLLTDSRTGFRTDDQDTLRQMLRERT
jgi:hypothetical protein